MLLSFSCSFEETDLEMEILQKLREKKDEYSKASIETRVFLFLLNILSFCLMKPLTMISGIYMPM